METFPAQPQEAPKRKSKFQIFLLAGLIAILIFVVILDVFSFMGKIKLKESTDTKQSSVTTQSPEKKEITNKETGESSTPADYKTCFSKYDKKFLPDIIENYQKYKVLENTSDQKENFAVAAARIKVNWGLSGLYTCSDQGYSFVATIVDSID